MKRWVMIGVVIAVGSGVWAGWNWATASSGPTCTSNGMVQKLQQLGPTETLAPPAGVQASVDASSACAAGIAVVPSDFTSASIQFGLFTDTAFYESVNDTIGPPEAQNRPAWVITLYGGCLPVSHPYGASPAVPVCTPIHVAVDASTGQVIEGFSGS